jgi:hypothetical protein
VHRAWKLHAFEEDCCFLCLMSSGWNSTGSRSLDGSRSNPLVVPSTPSDQTMLAQPALTAQHELATQAACSSHADRSSRPFGMLDRSVPHAPPATVGCEQVHERLRQTVSKLDKVYGKLEQKKQASKELKQAVGAVKDMQDSATRLQVEVYGLSCKKSDAVAQRDKLTSEVWRGGTK